MAFLDVRHQATMALGAALRGDPGPGRPDIPVRKPALFDERHIHELCLGSVAACCGPDFAIYEGRRAPRLPNGDLQLVSRIVEAHGTRGAFDQPAWLIAEFDVPTDAWFYVEDPSHEVPFSILMELGLQPCGFLSFWMGSTFIEPDNDFRFRNLDGRGELLRQVDLRGQTVQTRVELRCTTAMAGMIVQDFSMELACDGRPFYRGQASCGYFDTQALISHAGLDSGRRVPPWLAQQQGTSTSLDLRGDAGRALFEGSGALRLTGGHFDLLDRLTFAPQGGRFGAGYVLGERQVDPLDWFYANHFYQDPVMPGSLGMQAMIEALRAYALVTELGHNLHAPHFGQPLHIPTTWKYRGQILQSHDRMALEVHVKAIERTEDGLRLTADGSVWGNDLRIYEVTDLALTLVETGP